jgi:hypothetical protein
VTALVLQANPAMSYSAGGAVALEWYEPVQYKRLVLALSSAVATGIDMDISTLEMDQRTDSLALILGQVTAGLAGLRLSVDSARTDVKEIVIKMAVRDDKFDAELDLVRDRLVELETKNRESRAALVTLRFIVGAFGTAFTGLFGWLVSVHK